MYPSELKVIIYAARNLQPKKKGAVLAASVIFGIGKAKFRTEVVKGSDPTWNEESVFKVTAQNASLVLTVMDREDVLGLITLLVTQLPSAAHKRRWLPLKSKNHPTSSDLCFDCWVTEFKEDSVGIWNRIKTFSSGAPSPNEKRRESVINASTSIKGSTSSLELYSKSLEVDLEESSNEQIKSRKVSLVGKTNSSTDLNASPLTRSSIVEERALGGPKLLPTLGALMSMKGPPEITGVSPRFGPSTGGTKIIIRGCNLGLDKDDFLGFSICSCHYLDKLEYHSPAKLVCVTKPWDGSKPNPGPIVLVTKSGGRGVSTIEFEFKGKAISEAKDKISVKGRKSTSDQSAREALLSDIKRLRQEVRETPKKGKKSTSDQSAREVLLNDIKRLRQEVRETPKKGKKSTSDQDAREVLLNDITQLRQEVQGLRSENESLRSYIDSLMIVLMEQFPEALEATSKISSTDD